MRIVIDMQGAQTESRFRGIGRYTLSFAQAVVRNRGEHEIILALSGFFPNTIEPIRAAFDGLLPQGNIRVWHAPGPVHEEDSSNDSRREVAELIREAFLASLKPDVLHISSLFEGYVDDAVTSIGTFDHATPVSVSLYDLIPLVNPGHYLKPNPQYSQYYLHKFEEIKKAAVYLAISEFTRQEGLAHLDTSDINVVNVSTAIASHFQALNIDDDVATQLRQKFRITRPFLLYTGGADKRKNLPRLIQAFAALPNKLRSDHQLLLAGKMSDGHILEFNRLAKAAGIKSDDLLYTGYVTDEELVQLYNLCKLFVFPSWHEGFGLPALEAMACGAPVIGANTSSLPEVIALETALFDPFDVAAIVTKIAQGLEDNDFRAMLRKHGLQQAKRFSWDDSAKRAIAAWISILESRSQQKTARQPAVRKPRLAFVSPLPPERTGIADYSAELLPELAKHYDIEVVVAQENVSNAWVQVNCQIHDSKWLRANAHQIDRVLYHFGNSPFHHHMLTLVNDVPGTVVQHDFFLSGLLGYLEEYSIVKYVWVRALYHSHGYSAMKERYQAINTADVKVKYPVNLEVLQNAKGVIVHSEYSRKLASDWYGKDFAADWKVIPLLRKPCTKIDRTQYRAKLNLKPEDFVVCSFGFLDSTKLNHRLLEAWLKSRLAQDENCVLVFVGENHSGVYGKQLLETISDSGLKNRVRITGWVDLPIFQKFLSATDIAVQLRTESRGETSAAVLDCMNHALPIIVNAHGSMADLHSDAVWMMPDKFEDHQLVDALENLWEDDERRDAMGKHAQEIILTRHAPDTCATQYAEAIEYFHAQSQSSSHSLVKAIAKLKGQTPTDTECRGIAQTIAQSLPTRQPASQLLLDISATVRTNLKTGIERLARALVMTTLEAPPAGYRVEPVYLSNEGGAWHFRYARRYTLGLLECPTDALIDDVVEPRNGDVLLGLDLSGNLLINAEAAGLFTNYRNVGVSIHYVVYDLLPVQMPQFFPPDSDTSHIKWLQAIAKFDGAICISKTVANELSAWFETNVSQRASTYKIDWFHLGADIKNTAPTRGLPKVAEETLSQLSARPCFLMVGTIEPRKGYLQTLEAFTQLWHEGIDINLVIVGNEGWKDLPEDARRTIPEVIKRLRNDTELNKRLFWLEGISDEYLEKVYAASTCLIAASEGEGFGLPLIEAAQHGLPIIARDIPVFREVTQQNSYYFSGLTASELALSVSVWLSLNLKGNIPVSTKIQWNTWKQAAQKIEAMLIRRKDTIAPYTKNIKQQALDDHLNLIHAARIAMVRTLLPQGDYILDLGGANCPLYKMGYPYHFKKLTLIDLPPEQRHDYYKDVEIDSNCLLGPVVVRYTDMTTLEGIDDDSIDFVWSGQSIEHVPLEAGERMCREAFRVLKKGGAFCLDTPNRRLTEIHTATVGGGFIHPEHYIEYHPEQLMQILKAAGFSIKNSYGICEMPETLETGEFKYEDFIFGMQITDGVADGYIQFFHCLKA